MEYTVRGTNACIVQAKPHSQHNSSGRDKAAQRCIPIYHVDGMRKGVQPHLPQHVLPATVAKHVVKVGCDAG